MTLVVVNPRAGGGRASSDGYAAMRRTIEAALGPVDLVVTERPGHATELARERAARDGARALVVAVGGDGTFNEIVDGVLRAAAARTPGSEDAAGGRAKVAVVGRGTGGDLLRTLSVERRLDRCLEAIASGRERKLDVMRVRYTTPSGAASERACVNILSAGMGGLVDRYVADASRALGGKAAYFAASVKALLACRRGRLRCVVDGGPPRELRSYMIAVCNGRYFGSGMKVAPMAEIDDGRLEVVSLDAPNKLAFAVNANRIYDGTHVGRPHVEHFACTRIEIDLVDDDPRERFLIDCDGEAIGKLPLAIEVEPGAITLRG